MKNNKEDLDQLTKIYKEAWEQGIWLKEWGGNLCAAGCVKEVETIEEKTGEEIDIDKLTLGDCVNLAWYGHGATRIEACLNAIKKFEQKHKKHKKYHQQKK